MRCSREEGNPLLPENWYENPLHKIPYHLLRMKNAVDNRGDATIVEGFSPRSM